MHHAVNIKAVLCSLVFLSATTNAQEKTNIPTATQQSAAQTLNFSQALNFALANEPWSTASRYQQKAAIAQSIKAGTLPDPVLTFGLINLPTNGYAFDQEGMTQFKVDIGQKFGRGNSLALTQKAQEQFALQFPWQRADRLAQVKAIVKSLGFVLHFVV